MGQQGTLTRVWARKGTRPRAPKDCRYAWAYIFGAVCPARRTGAALVMPYANTEAMNAHLAEISGQVSPGAHALRVLDGAGWHSSTVNMIRKGQFRPELRPFQQFCLLVA